MISKTKGAKLVEIFIYVSDAYEKEPKFSENFQRNQFEFMLDLPVIQHQDLFVKILQGLNKFLVHN